MTEPTCRVRCKVCPCEWHARDPVASWRNHWQLMHTEATPARRHTEPVTVPRSMFDRTR